MAKSKPFIISDDSLSNRYDYRVLTSGIATDNYMKNPVVYYNHDWMLIGAMPIGITKELSVKGSQLLAYPEFDKNDKSEETQRIIQKIEDGILKGASIGFDIIELSDDPDLMLKGQARSTVSKSELLEWSVTGLPANRNCVRLSYSKKGVLLSTSSVDEDVLNQIIPIIHNNPTKMKEIARKLGLKPDADEQQILSAIDALRGQSVKVLMQIGRDKGFVTDKNEQAIKKLAESDYNSVLSLIDAHTPQATPSSEEGQQQVLITEVLKATQNGGTPPTSSKDEWTFLEWEQKDPEGLAAMRNSNFDKYKALAAGYRGQ